jgi:Cys-tRNA(Pro)/Cys-tRNA(Cys) deacylase
MKKTNAARLLDNYRINYEIVVYEVNEDDLSAISVATKLGQNVEQVFKTLVLRGNANGIFVVVVPGDAEVNLKKAAKISGNKSAEMVHMKELLGLTGYIRGACSPFGMKKNYPTFIHETCLNFEYIYVSAGKRGMQLKLAPNDLISCTGAIVCDLIGG